MKEEYIKQVLDLDYRPRLPDDKSIGIGIVGAGDIVVNCHLPAYRMAGFHVIGIYDVSQDKAKQAAERFGIPHVFKSLQEMLAREDVKIVDIAVPVQFQLGIVKEVAAAGKHVLCQKPLAASYEDAKQMAEICGKASVKAAVNQQMRWAPGIRASRSIIRHGWIGQPLQASIQVNVLTKWETWPWLAAIDTLEVMYHSIHYMDSIRSVMGMTPEYIYADGARVPHQASKGETRTMIHMKFPGDARGMIHDNHNNGQPSDDWYATYRFEGTEGVIKGTNGALYNYPVGREDTLGFYSRVLYPNYLFTPQLEGRWFPHAFMGTMGELMCAIEEDREPENSIADNLQTMQMVFAAYRSMAENRPVFLSEI